jgi:carnitine O-acetyltransferase
MLKLSSRLASRSSRSLVRNLPVSHAYDVKLLLVQLVSRMATKRNFKSSAPKGSVIPEGYAVDPTAGNMLQFQASLPRLPVPALSSTVHKYLETIRPLLTDAEYTKSQATAQEFLQSSQAAELQKRLEARATDPSIKNWLADWWNDAAYMGYRDPVVVYVSYFYVHLDDPRRRDPAKRAASLIKAMLPFREITESSVFRMSLALFYYSCQD